MHNVATKCYGLAPILLAHMCAFLSLVNHEMPAIAGGSRRWLEDRSHPATKHTVHPVRLSELMMYHRFEALVALG